MRTLNRLLLAGLLVGLSLVHHGSREQLAKSSLRSPHRVHLLSKSSLGAKLPSSSEAVRGLKPLSQYFEGMRHGLERNLAFNAGSFTQS